MRRSSCIRSATSQSAARRIAGRALTVGDSPKRLMSFLSPDTPPAATDDKRVDLRLRLQYSLWIQCHDGARLMRAPATQSMPHRQASSMASSRALLAMTESNSRRRVPTRATRCYSPQPGAAATSSALGSPGAVAQASSTSVTMRRPAPSSWQTMRPCSSM